MKIAIVIASVLAGLVVIGAAGAVYWVAGNVRVNETVRAVNANIATMNAEGGKLESLAKNGPSFPDLGAAQSTADFLKLAQQYDTSIQTYDGDLNQADDVVADAKRLLADSQSKVNSAASDWLTIPHRSRLDRERKSLGYEQQAFADAQEIVNVARKQLQGYKAVVQGLSDYVQLADALDANHLQDA